MRHVRFGIIVLAAMVATGWGLVALLGRVYASSSSSFAWMAGHGAIVQLATAIGAIVSGIVAGVTLERLETRKQIRAFEAETALPIARVR